MSSLEKSNTRQNISTLETSVNKSLDLLETSIYNKVDLRASLENLALNLSNNQIHCVSQEHHEAVKALCLAHPVFPRLHEDPYTRRGYSRPRGFAGDAGLMDFFHGLRGPDANDSPLGVSLFNLNMKHASCTAVRYRRSYFAQAIDHTQKVYGNNSHILSIACGHLREADFSNALQSRKIGSITALDQDTKALETIEQDYGHLGINICEGSIVRLISGGYNFSEMNLIYASGLYDYLDDRIAIKLTKSLAKQLAKHGKLIIPNFLPTINERGYMSFIMNWDLIYRTQKDLQNLANSLPHDQFKSEIKIDPTNSIAYLTIIRTS